MGMMIPNCNNYKLAWLKYLCVLFVVVFIRYGYADELSTNFYETSCPKALSIIRNAVVNAIFKDKDHRMGASLLRLHFHDCFVNGCDASVLLDDTSTLTGEKTAGANINSLRGFEVIDDIKSQLESACPAVVSCADILALAARHSVLTLGGPSWTVGLGRRDSTTASKDTATQDIPSPLMDLSALISAFDKKGFSTKEMVVLSGAHTTGKARCQLFRGRIYNESTSIDTSYATSVKSNCPTLGSDDVVSPLDVTTNVIFDNAYFTNLVNKKGLLHSDQQLYTGNGGSTDSLVAGYGSDPAAFSRDFAAAMLKMSNLSPLTGTSGQIRTNCRKVN